VKTAGFFDLQSPKDLLVKARVDLDRFQSDPLSTYAAFDFFVAIRHLPDWMHPDDPESKQRTALAEEQRKTLFERHVELRISRHIADGAKHFVATHRQNYQVEGTSVAAAFQVSGDAFQAGGFQGRSLFIKLDSRDPDTHKLGGDWIPALQFAEQAFKVAETIVSSAAIPSRR